MTTNRDQLDLFAPQMDLFDTVDAPCLPSVLDPPVEPTYIVAARRVLANSQYETVDGAILDGVTAKAMVTVWEALSDEQRAVLAGKAMPLTKYVTFVWKALTP